MKKSFNRAFQYHSDLSVLEPLRVRNSCHGSTRSIHKKQGPSKRWEYSLAKATSLIAIGGRLSSDRILEVQIEEHRLTDAEIKASKEL